MIRAATIDDARAIATIHAEGWLAAYQHIFPPEAFAYRTADIREREFREVLSSPDAGDRIWVAERNGEVVGFAYTRERPEPDIPAGGELKLFYVAPARKGGGIGLPLFEFAVGDIFSRGFEPYLYTLKENHAARAWYEHRGWRCDGSEMPWSDRGEFPDVVEVRYRPG